MDPRNIKTTAEIIRYARGFSPAPGDISTGMRFKITATGKTWIITSVSEGVSSVVRFACLDSDPNSDPETAVASTVKFKDWIEDGYILPAHLNVG